MSAALALLTALQAVLPEPSLCAASSAPSTPLRVLQERLLRERAVHEAADVLESILLADEAPEGGPATEDPPPLLLPHERVRLEAEALVLAHRQLVLRQEVEAAAEALGLVRLPAPGEEVEGEARWTPPLVLERGAVLARARLQGGPAAASRVSPLLGALQRTGAQLAHLEVEVVPAAEEALGAVLVALTQREARAQEVLEALRLSLWAQEALLARQLEREGQLEALAALLGCPLATLPACFEQRPPPARPKAPPARAQPLL